MRSRTANWFLCKIRYEKLTDEGLQKKVTEQYVVDALSFTEAEARIMYQMATYVSGEFEVVEIDRCKFSEVFFSDEEYADQGENFGGDAMEGLETLNPDAVTSADDEGLFDEPDAEAEVEAYYKERSDEAGEDEETYSDKN